jgi:hypothetical protein
LAIIAFTAKNLSTSKNTIITEIGSCFMDTTSTSTALPSLPDRKQDGPSCTINGRSTPSEQPFQRELKVPMMIRPTHSQKACVEQIAEQIGMKRSQLDATFYLTGALLIGVEGLNTSEQIGTWSRKEVATYLKRAFTPLFELLYEQDELPLAFALLLGRCAIAPVPISQRDQGELMRSAMSHEPKQVLPLTGTSSDTRLPPFLSADAEMSLDGFPEDI